MLSVILSHANSNETSFTGLKDVAVAERRVRKCFLAIHADASLLDEAPCIATALGKSRLDERRHQVSRIISKQVGNFFGNFALAELGLEVGLGTCGSLLA